MSRKQKLTASVNQYLEHDNQGSFKTRQHRRFIMTRIINDLFVARMVPATWYGLTTEHIISLIVFWEKKGLQNATLMNYLVGLRYFLNKINHPLDHIDNQSLGLVKPRCDSKPAIQADAILNVIDEPIAYMLFALQSKFGLTLIEAMSLTPSIHIQDNELWITREISSNHKDRLIPLVSDAQQRIVSKLTTMTSGTKSLSQTFGEPHLRLAYKFMLSTLKLPTQVNYRYLYAKSRFAYLCKNHTNQESKQIVIAETHLNKTSPLWKTIHE